MRLSRPVDAALLQQDLLSSRALSTHLTRDLQGEQLFGPRLGIVNPPLWELGHLAWFQEHWCLRHREGGTLAESIVPRADALYDSAKVAHATRWDLPLLDAAQTRDYQAAVLERVLQRLTNEPDDTELQYFAQLCIYHEDMHAEAFHYTRQTLGYADPFPAVAASPAASALASADVELRGGVFALGARHDEGFVFDNEKWAHDVRIDPFRIARTPVTNAEYLAFVEAGGYLNRDWWDEAGWRWRVSADAQAPHYWYRQGPSWMARRFEAGIALRLEDPVIHVNWHEANAYCRYARRRLPSEPEWEYAAACDAAAGVKRRYPWGDAPPAPGRANLEGHDVVAANAYPAGDSAGGCRQMIGNAWEWTASAFAAYPGFVVDPYREYSQPWFGTHKVLRGGSYATTRRLIRNTWRNFYTPDRNDVFAGFRTCAVDD